MDSLSFDGWGRLVGWRQYRKTPPGSSFQPFASDSFGFDATGNLRVIGETRWHDPVTDRLDSLVRGSSTFRYTYDLAGNLTQSAETGPGGTLTWKYGYDALNRLRAVRYRGSGWGADSLVARYAYDVLGRRIAKRVYWSPVAGAGARYQRYVYHGDQVAFETDSAGTMTSKYSWAPGVDNLLGFTDSTGTYYNVVTDHLGSVRGLVRRDGTWMMHQRFTPYGTRLARDSTGALPPLRYGWTGREHDTESGLVYFRARYYDPGQRRFTQEDPIGHAGGLNVYGYVGGQPLSARDPSGRILICTDYYRTKWLEDPRFPGIRIGQTTEFIRSECTVIDLESLGGGIGAGGVGGGGPAPPGQPPVVQTPKPPEEDPRCAQFTGNANLRQIASTLNELGSQYPGRELGIATDQNFRPVEGIRLGERHSIPSYTGRSPLTPSNDPSTMPSAVPPPSDTRWIVHLHTNDQGLSGYNSYTNQSEFTGDAGVAANRVEWLLNNGVNALHGVISVFGRTIWVGPSDGSNRFKCSF